MSDCLIALGCNQGDCLISLRAACQMIRGLPQTELTAVSPGYPTLPVGMAGSKSRFLNAAAKIRTQLDPHRLIEYLSHIEDQIGRSRAAGPDREIDLDLLLFDEETINTPGLQLPHPRMSFRRFVLEPVVEIAAEMVHPVCRMSLAELLEHLGASANLICVLAAGRPTRPSVCDEISSLDSRLSVDIMDFLDKSLETTDPGRWHITFVSAQDFVNWRAKPSVKLYVRMHAPERLWQPIRGPKLDLWKVAEEQLPAQLAAAVQAMMPLAAVETELFFEV